MFGLRLFRSYGCALVSTLLRLACCLSLFMCPSVKYWFGILYIYRYDGQQLYIESQSHYAPSGREYRMVIGRLHGWSLLHNLFPISSVRFSFVSFSILYFLFYSSSSLMLFHWFVDSLSWRDQTDPALHLKKADWASVYMRADSFRMETDRMNRIAFWVFSFKLYFFFLSLLNFFALSLIPWIPPGSLTTTIYISLFPSLINRKQIPLLWKKKGYAHKSWLLFFFSLSFLFILILGTFLRHWRLAPTCIEATRKEKKKKKHQIYAQTLHNNNNTTFPLATPPIPISLLVFLVFFFSFSFFSFPIPIFSCLSSWPLLFLSLFSYIKTIRWHWAPPKLSDEESNQSICPSLNIFSYISYRYISPLRTFAYSLQKPIGRNKHWLSPIKYFDVSRPLPPTMMMTWCQ